MKNIMQSDLNELNIDKVIIWGIKSHYHSHYFIHQSFYNNFKKLNIKTLWLEDNLINNKYIDEKSLVIAINICSKFLNLNKQAMYCLHNFYDQDIKSLPFERYINLQVITEELVNKYYDKSILLSGFSFYNSEFNTLFQSWGCPLQKKEFFFPKFASSNIEFFIGSIWNNDLNQGNINEIHEYRQYLNEKKVRFIHCKNLPEKLSPYYIRESKYAASILGNWQKKNGYTPCRVFKAIGYGKLGITNSKISSTLYPFLKYKESIGEIIDYLNSLDEERYIEIVNEQQNKLVYETYEYKIKNIVNAFKSKK